MLQPSSSPFSGLRPVSNSTILLHPFQSSSWRCSATMRQKQERRHRYSSFVTSTTQLRSNSTLPSPSTHVRWPDFQYLPLEFIKTPSARSFSDHTRLSSSLPSILTLLDREIDTELPRRDLRCRHTWTYGWAPWPFTLRVLMSRKVKSKWSGCDILVACEKGVDITTNDIGGQRRLLTGLGSTWETSLVRFLFPNKPNVWCAALLTRNVEIYFLRTFYAFVLAMLCSSACTNGKHTATKLERDITARSCSRSCSTSNAA